MNKLLQFLRRFGPLIVGCFLATLGFSLLLVKAILKFQQGDPWFLVIWFFGVAFLFVGLYHPVRYMIRRLR